ncbi:MAG: hypothetical protein WD971_11780 [Pirellulales bacterium]
MANEHLFSADVAGPGTPVQGKSRWQSCLTGCLVVFVILMVIAILSGFWISRNWRRPVAWMSTWAIQQVIDSSTLAINEKQEIMVQVDRVASAFRQNAISEDQFEQLLKHLFESPFVSLIMATEIDRQYLPESGLSQEEKDAGGQTLDRFIRGAIDKQINQAEIDAAMAHVAIRNGNNWQLRKALTDEELREFFAEAKKQADAAGIPEQPADIDPSEEIKKVVDDALAAPA